MKTQLQVLQEILKELKGIRKLLKPEINGIEKHIISELDTEKYIKLEMKDYMTPRYLFEECKKLFPIWIWEEKYLDEVTSDIKGNYRVYFKNAVEADEENKNLSAND